MNNSSANKPAITAHAAPMPPAKPADTELPPPLLASLSDADGATVTTTGSLDHVRVREEEESEVVALGGGSGGKSPSGGNGGAPVGRGPDGGPGGKDCCAGDTPA